MARQTRIHYPGALYHVILRAVGDEQLFYADDDYRHFYALLAEGVERFGCRIYAFCLLSDHIHLAVEVGTTPLSRLMQNISFRHTRHINTRRKRTGRLFHDRYKALLVDADNWLLDLVRYIHLNPTRSGLGLDPKTHPWSSYRAYCGMEELPWLSVDPIRGRFDPHERVAINRYQRFIVDALRDGHRPEFHKGSGVDRRVLGDATFIDRLPEQNETEANSHLSIDAVLEAVCTEYNLNRKRLRAPGKERITAEARAVAALVVFEEGIGTLEELGRQLNRSGSTLSSAVTRLKKRVKQDEDLADGVQSLRRQITELHT